MNRLSLGAVGLLVALAIFSTASASTASARTPIAQDNEKDVAMIKFLLGTTDAAKYRRGLYVKMAKEVLINNKAEGVEETDETKKLLTLAKNYGKITNQTLQTETVTKLFLAIQEFKAGLSARLGGHMEKTPEEQLGDKLGNINNVLMDSMKEVGKTAGSKVPLTDKDKDVLKFLKGKDSDEDHTIVLKDAYNLHLEHEGNKTLGIESKELGGAKMDENHIHGTGYNREEWFNVYHGLPDTSKYAHNGLHPKIKAHLNAGLKIAESNNNDDYKELKEKSEQIIKKHATEARKEALAHATTMAARYMQEHKLLEVTGHGHSKRIPGT